MPSIMLRRTGLGCSAVRLSFTRVRDSQVHHRPAPGNKRRGTRGTMMGQAPEISADFTVEVEAEQFSGRYPK